MRIDRRRKLPVTVLLKALGFTSERDIIDMFDGDAAIKNTLEKDPMKIREEGVDPDKIRQEALIEIYRRLRPGEPTTADSAEMLMTGMFFDPHRYDLAKVGRYKLNAKLDVNVSPTTTILTQDDIIAAIKRLIHLSHGLGEVDDIDHFGNRRVRTVGELVQNQLRIGLSRVERIVRERMTTIDVEAITPQALVNVKPIIAAIKEFFGGSPLSQFMDQTNPLTGLTHERRLSALGPGGLSRASRLRGSRRPSSITAGCVLSKHRKARTSA